MGSLWNVDGSTGNLVTAGSITSTSTTSGFLLPQLTTTQRNAISNPATGLQVFNTTTNEIEFYNGSTWQAVAGGNVNSGTTGQVAYYAATGTTLSGSSTVSVGSSGITLNGVNVGISNSNAFAIGSSSVLGLSGSPWVEFSSSLYVAGNNNIQFTDTQSPAHTVTLSAPSTIVSSYTLKWPTAQATASGQVLTNDGSGNLSWATGSGTITGSGSTNSIPVFTGSTALGNSGLTDNGITITSSSRLFEISYPGNTFNPTTEYQLFLYNGSVRTYFYENFFNQFTFSSNTSIATIGSGFNASADVLVFGNGFSGNTRSFIDKVLVCCNGNTASATTYTSTSTGSPIARTYTATASGGTITLSLQMSGNAAVYQVSVLVTALWNQ